jgi:D-xylose transport system substrate-binding protein
VAISLSGCADVGSTSGPTSTRACVILPDTSSSTRWEESDRPALERAAEDAGFAVEIGNAQGDAEVYAAVADELLAEGCGVMILTDFAGAARAVVAQAHDAGIPVIAYDRPLAGADYLVSFDYAEIGRMQGGSIVRALAAAGRAPALATVYYVGADANDATTSMIREGAIEVLSEAGVTAFSEFAGASTAESLAANFSTALDAHNGRVDAVWAANDTTAATVVTVLADRGVTAAVTGQDATIDGLRNVLRGAQVSTIAKSYRDEATAAAKVAVKLLFGDVPDADGELDGTPFVEVRSELVTVDNLASYLASSSVSTSSVCAGLEDRCAALGITS